MASAHDGIELANLPGNYQPEIAAIPTPQQDIGQGGASQGQQTQGQRRKSNDLSTDRQGRKSLSQIDDGPRPSANVGGQQQHKKPRTILDLIFGG